MDVSRTMMIVKKKCYWALFIWSRYFGKTVGWAFEKDMRPFRECFACKFFNVQQELASSSMQLLLEVGQKIARHPLLQYQASLLEYCTAANTQLQIVSCYTWEPFKSNLSVFANSAAPRCFTFCNKTLQCQANRASITVTVSLKAQSKLLMLNWHEKLEKV